AQHHTQAKPAPI
ncbi:unnamed protein product, partial [Adineta ricciae]